MKKQLIFLFLICTAAVQAQSLDRQVVASAGGYQENATLSLSYTLGELAVQTLTAGNLILTQGFQQPLGIGTFSPEQLYPDWQVKTWPNPVAGDLYLEISTDVRTAVILETFDLSGRLYLARRLETPLQSDPYTLDLSNLEKGIYILKIRTADYSLQRIVKISKQ